MNRSTTILLFAVLAALTGDAAAQCILANVMSVYPTCSGVQVNVAFTQTSATPPYEFQLDVDGFPYDGVGSDPNGFTYEVPWSGNDVVSTVALALHDAADCSAFNS